MCFQSRKRDYVKEGEGWKIFNLRKDVLYSTHCAHRSERDIPRPLDIWLKAKQYLEENKRYRTRWSFFESEEDAEEILKYIYEDCVLDYPHIIRKILFRDSNYKGIVSWNKDWISREVPSRQALWIKILN